MRLLSYAWRPTIRFAAISMVAAVAILATSRADAQQRLISKMDAGRLSLTRAWYAVAAVDPNRGRLQTVVVEEKTIFALTDRGALQAIDAGSGATLWVSSVGNPNYPSLGPAANDEYVAVVNGSTLYVLGRKQGDRTHEWQLSSGAGGGPCFLGDFVYATLFNGTLEAHQLSNPTAPAWRHQTQGRPLVQPIATEERVLWPNDQGHIYAGSADPPGVDFRLEAHGEILAQPAYLEPMIFAASVEGYVYAIDAANGSQRWRYAMGSPVRTAPAAVLDRVFVCSSRPEMVCLNATLESQLDVDKGVFQWRAPRITRFVARSLNRVYAADAFDRLYVLDINSGEKLGTLSTQGMSVPVVNQSTDRIYLASPGGLIQCLHEIDSPTSFGFAAEIERRSQGGGTDGAAGGDQGPAKDDPFGDEEAENSFE